MSTHETTVVIPVYNNPVGCKELISDFYRLHDIDKFRFIVIDQTKDGITFEEGTPVHLHIRAYRNLGFSKAINTGWKLSQTPYTLLANDDVRLLSASWYEEAKAHLKDGVLGVNPFPALRTWNAGGEPVWYWETNPDFAWTKDKPYESYTQEEYEKLKQQLGPGDGPGTTMFFTLLRTEARDTVGLLDEAYWCGGEDYDWNRRCYLRGYQILTCKHSIVHHESSVSKGRAVEAKEANGYDLVAHNRNIFNEKWGDGADIYGKQGVEKPKLPWCRQVDL